MIAVGIALDLIVLAVELRGVIPVRHGAIRVHSIDNFANAILCCFQLGGLTFRWLAWTVFRFLNVELPCAGEIVRAGKHRYETKQNQNRNPSESFHKSSRFGVEFS